MMLVNSTHLNIHEQTTPVYSAYKHMYEGEDEAKRNWITDTANYLLFREGGRGDVHVNYGN